MTYDDLPILGRAPNRENLWLATGHGMMGMGMSAITGQLARRPDHWAQPGDRSGAIESGAICLSRRIGESSRALNSMATPR